MVGEADHDEERREHAEAHDLDRLAAPDVEEGDRHPVARQRARKDEDQVADGLLVVDLVDVGAARVADGGQDDGVVEREAVVGDVEEEPRARRAQQDLAVLPPPVVRAEVLPAGLGGCEFLGTVS